MSLSEAFSNLPDPRRSQGLRTDLESLLIMVVLSYLAGHTGYRGIKRFCEANSAILQEELSLRHGIPSHVTFHHVLSHLDDSALTGSFNTWSSQLGIQDDWFSGDGKVLGSTVSDCHGSSQDFQATVSFFAQRTGITKRIGHYRNKDKQTGEQQVARLLIGELKGLGVVLCTDALHTQKKPRS